MSLTQVTGPYPIFTDLDGTPLDDGYLFIGDVNDDPETNPIQAYWDSNLTIPATQPIRTNNGYAWRNGTPGLIYTAGPFSITIRNKKNEFVLYSPVGYGFDPAAVSASVVKNDFTGDGVEVNFTLSASPSTKLATNVFINGVYQEKDSYTLSGNVITFSVAPPLGSSIEVMTNETGVINTGNATAISYTLTAPGAVQQTVQARLEHYVSVKDFGAVGDGVTDDYAAIVAAWQYCYPLGVNLYFPSGTYLVVGNNFPFRNPAAPVVSLLDCNNMTIFGDGPGSILKTSSVNGADVLQLNGLKNFHVRDLQLQSVISGAVAGSNGISVTGGFDNITVDNVWAKDLAYVDAITYVDGGKAVSIQPPSEVNPITMGSFKATNIFADGCVYGFGYEPDNDLALIQPVSIEVDIVVMNSRQGVVISAGAASAALPANSTSGVRVRGQSINCMQDIVVSRAFGVDIDMQIIQTKTAAQLLLSYLGTQWTVADTITDVIGVKCAYAKNSRIVAYGNKKDCRHKALIGGALDGSSGISGATDYCDFYLDITGVSAGADVQFVDAGGNIMANSRLYVTTSTALTLPIEFYDPALDNTITLGPDIRLQKLHVTNEIGWTQPDGRTIQHNLFIQTGALTAKQTSSSSNDFFVQQWVNQAGSPKFAIRNDGAVATAGRITATSVATVKAVLPIYDEGNALFGYVPVYTSFS